jgi:hypothetical protein
MDVDVDVVMLGCVDMVAFSFEMLGLRLLSLTVLLLTVLFFLALMTVSPVVGSG